MSLILEALRKSEAERRRGQAPDVLADMPVAQPTASRTLPAWVWLLPVVVALLLGLWFVQQRRDPAPTAAEAPPAERLLAGPDQPPEPELPPVRRLTAAPVAAPQPPPAATTTAPVTNVEPAQSKRVQPQPTDPRPAPAKPTPATAPARVVPPDSTRVAARIEAEQPPAPDEASNAGQIVSLSDLSTAEREALPPLKISMHLWNADPAQRFVILDGNRVVEGDRIGNAVVKSITSDGVILDWQGQRIKLPIR